MQHLKLTRFNHVHITDNKILSTTIVAPSYERSTLPKKPQPTILTPRHSAWHSTLIRAMTDLLLTPSKTTKPQAHHQEEEKLKFLFALYLDNLRQNKQFAPRNNVRCGRVYTLPKKVTK